MRRGWRMCRWRFAEKIPDDFPAGSSPAGVVDDDVKEHAGAEPMCGPGEFAKLIHTGGAFVEFNQRRINGGQIQAGIRAAKTPKRA